MTSDEIRTMIHEQMEDLQIDAIQTHTPEIWNIACNIAYAKYKDEINSYEDKLKKRDDEIAMLKKEIALLKNNASS